MKRKRRKKKEAKVVMHNDEWSLGWLKWIMHESFQCISICVFFFSSWKDKEKEKEEEKKKMSTDFSLVVCYRLIGEFFFLLCCLLLILSNRFLFSNRKNHFMIWAIHSSEKKNEMQNILFSWMMQAWEFCHKHSSLLHAYLNTNHQIRLLPATVCTTTTTTYR
jgi:hypothetical protein